MTDLIRRHEWGARPPNHDAPAEKGFFHPRHNPGGWLLYPSPLNDILTTLVIHHSALDVGVGVAQIQHLHQETNGWADIGYHFVIDGAGKLYEARPLTVRGVHVRGANTGTVGVVLLGNFEQHLPTAAQLRTLDQQIGGLLQAYPHLSHIAGHADFNEETVCPGRYLLPLLRPLAQKYHRQWGTGGYRQPDWAR